MNTIRPWARRGPRAPPHHITKPNFFQAPRTLNGKVTVKILGCIAHRDIILITRQEQTNPLSEFQLD